MATNQENGEIFGLIYSAVSQRVRVIKVLLNNDKELEQKKGHAKHDTASICAVLEELADIKRS